MTADAEKDVASFVDETIKNKSQNVGVYFTYECFDGTQESNEESDGQLSLFDTPKEQKKENFYVEVFF